MKIVSLNCWFHHLSYSSLHNRSERLQQICKWLQAQDADMICLQEVFHMYISKMMIGGYLTASIRDALPDHHTFTHSPCTSSIFDCFQNSGLFFASKQIPSVFLSHSFRNTWFTRKGFTLAKYDDVIVVNLHLDAFSRTSRAEQIVELCNELHGRQHEIVICGDWNMPPEEFLCARDRIQLTILRQLYHSPLDVNTHADGCLDIFVASVPIHNFKVHIEETFSDHFAVSCEVFFENHN
jgi:endonuclease/exonuclease/phosphatase family metal-dependent hydrolase